MKSISLQNVTPLNLLNPLKHKLKVEKHPKRRSREVDEQSVVSQHQLGNWFCSNSLLAADPPDTSTPLVSHTLTGLALLHSLTRR